MSRINISNTENFAELRQGNGYYVDKTDFLEEFLKDYQRPDHFRSPGAATLFTRPHRFGKTLFLSMLAEFFDISKDSAQLFAGLKVSSNEALCKTWMNKYPVLFVSLKRVTAKNFEDALDKLGRLIGDLCLKHRILLKSKKLDREERKTLKALRKKQASRNTLCEALLILSRAMYYHYEKPAILLIDEYDVPVAEAEENGYYDEMIDFFKEFFSNGLKTNEYLKMAVLTGCLRIVRESVFTGLNNLTCYGVSDEKFSDIFGFTQTEVDTLLTEAGLAQRKEEVKNWYDGYCFGDTQEVYCPWSIMRYIDDAQGKPNTRPKAYWLHTSANALLQRLIDGSTSDLTDVIDTLLEGGSFVAKLNLCPTYGQLSATPENIWSLLYQTGYLTRIPKGMPDKSLLPESDLELLAIPNREIAWLFREELEHWFSKQVTASQRNGLCTAFWKPDAELFAKLLSETLLVSISMYDYKEHFYHGMLAGIFISTAAQTFSNLETGEGRSDILIIDNRKAAVIEVKRTTRVQDLPALVEEGMQQIAAKQYDTRVKAIPMVRTILHWSIAFCKKTCLAKARIVRHEE